MIPDTSAEAVERLAKRIKRDIDWRPGSLCADAATTLRALLAERDRLAAEVERLRAALMFYADDKNWRDTPPWDDHPSCITPKAIPVRRDQDGSPCDCGDVARAALAGEGRGDG